MSHLPLHPPLLKALGQHHLVQAEILDPLVDFLEVPDRPVVEIGPGGGVLTARLLDAGARLVALELDPAWAFRLAEAEPRLAGRLAIGDAMDVAWSRLPEGSLVTGNLPYQIATALIRRLLPLRPPPERLGFMVQLEVAERLAAGPGSRDYGALSVVAGLAAEVEILRKVAPGSFRPPPKVWSAVVGLRPRPLPVPPERFDELEAVLHAAFGQRRKTLRNALGSVWGRERAETALAAAGIDAGARAETVPPEGFVALWRSARDLT